MCRIIYYVHIIYISLLKLRTNQFASVRANIMVALIFDVFYSVCSEVIRWKLCFVLFECVQFCSIFTRSLASCGHVHFVVTCILWSHVNFVVTCAFCEHVIIL